MCNIFDFLNKLDVLNLFGYIPKLKIRRKECYKSNLGAIVFTIYFSLFWYFLYLSIKDYITKFNEVDKIKYFNTNSEEFKIQSQD